MILKILFCAWCVIMGILLVEIIKGFIREKK
jgi:hypothetical protein